MLRKWEPGTIRTYLSALRQLLAHAPPDSTLADAISLRLLHLAATRRSPSAAKILVSAIIMCQRLSLIPEVLTESHRLTLSAIVKYTSHRTIPKPWATIQHVQSIGRLRMYWGWARLYFLIMASTIYLWRVQDAAGIQWRWLQIPGWITFYDHKINRELVGYPLSDYMDAWRAYIVACKRSDVPWDAAVIPGGARELQRAMADLLRYEELAEVRWHGWKKLGAALFILLGGALSSLQRWGRWHSPHQPRRYSHAPPAWRLPDRVQLPYPVATTNSPVRDMEWRLVRLSELWPRDTFAKPCTAPVRAPQQLELAYAATYQPSSTGRESDETPSIGESTDTDRSDVQSQCSESTSMAQSESMEAPPTTNHAIHHGVTTPPPAGEPLATCPATAPGGCPSMGAVASAVAPTPLPSSQVPDGVHHGSTGGLEGRMGTVRPAGPISEPPAKRPMCGHQPTSDPTPHHGYELTAPRRGDAYAHWRPLWLRETASEPVQYMSHPHTTTSPTECRAHCPEIESVGDECDYVVAGFDCVDGEPPTSGPPPQPTFPKCDTTPVPEPFTPTAAGAAAFAIGACTPTTTPAGHRSVRNLRHLSHSTPQPQHRHQPDGGYPFASIGDP